MATVGIKWFCTAWNIARAALFLAAWPFLTTLAHADDVSTIEVAEQATHNHQAAVDLGKWDFENQGAINLNEGWYVFRDELLDPSEFLHQSCGSPHSNIKPENITLPDRWGPALTSTVSTGHGVATYCIEFILPESASALGMKLGSLRTISSVTAIVQENSSQHLDIVPLYRNGDPRNHPKSESYNPTVPVMPLFFDGAHVKLVIQLANYVHKQGGISGTPSIDIYSRLDSGQRRDAALPMALVLVLLVVSLGTFVIGRLYGDQKRYNIFAFLTLASALRVFFVSDIVWDYIPTFPLWAKYNLEYASLFIVLPAYYAFVVMLFGERKNWIFSKFVYTSSCFLVVLALFAAPFLPPGSVTLLREPFQLLWGGIGTVIIFVLIKAVIKKGNGKTEVLVALAAAAVMAVYELLSALAIIPLEMDWSQLLVLLVTCMHARAFAVNFRRVEIERDQLTEKLIEANSVLEQKAADLVQALSHAQEASRAKNEFLATMSHELRTPLNAIIGFSEVMDREAFGPMENAHYKDYTKDIFNSGKHLLAIINDILDLARIESGNDELYEDEFEVDTVAAAMLRIVGPQAALREVTLQLDCASNLPCLRADQRKFKQILINLLSNAIKFNVDGGTVCLSVMRVDQSLCITVADTGIGMKTEDIPRALTRFQQVDSHLSRQYEGLGIGLSLVSALCDQHEATLNIESEVGVGTKVTILFPAARTLCNERKIAG